VMSFFFGFGGGGVVYCCCFWFFLIAMAKRLVTASWLRSPSVAALLGAASDFACRLSRRRLARPRNNKLFARR